jgi:hypothetical protein
MMEAVRTTETSVYFNGTIRRFFPEGCHFETLYSPQPLVGVHSFRLCKRFLTSLPCLENHTADQGTEVILTLCEIRGFIVLSHCCERLQVVNNQNILTPNKASMLDMQIEVIYFYTQNRFTKNVVQKDALS